MSRYEGRHAPKHASARRSTTAKVVGALSRPAVSASLVLAIVGTGAAGFQVADSRQTGAAGFTVSAEAVSQANELSDQLIEDSARLTADRNAALAQQALIAGKAQEAARAKAAALAKARAEAKAKAAREAQRVKLIADAVADPKGAAQAIMGDYGFGQDQWSCLDQLWIGESGWNHTAENSSSGAYGIPQSLPASKMASVADDYRTNPVTQIKWGLQYIKDAYGTPCNALGMWNSRSPHWY